MSGIKISDSELAILAKDGDAGAFNKLVLRHHHDLSVYVSSICKNSIDSEDICQESYRKAFLSIGSFNSDYPFKVWLFSIAKNTAIDHLRRKSVFNTVNYEDAEETAIHTPETEASPEETMIDEQSYRHFMETLESLPELYRAPAKLRLLNSLTYEEISHILDVPLNTVKTRIRRAKVMIEDILQSM